MKDIEPYLLEQGLDLLFSKFCFETLSFFVYEVVHAYIMTNNVFLNEDDRQ